MTNNELTLDQLRDVQGGIFLLLLAACKVKKASTGECGTWTDIGGDASVNKGNDNLKEMGYKPHCHPTGLGSGNTQGQVKDDCENLPF